MGRRGKGRGWQGRGREVNGRGRTGEGKEGSTFHLQSICQHMHSAFTAASLSSPNHYVMTNGEGTPMLPDTAGLPGSGEGAWAS